MAIEDNSHVQGFVAIDGNDSQKHPLDIDPEYVMGYPRSSGSSVTLAERLDTLVSMGGTQTITGEKTFTAPISGTISVAEKLQTARNLGVALDGSAAAPFDGSANQLSIPVSGTLPIANGGTGATAVADIQAGKDGAGNTITSTYVDKTTYEAEMAEKADITGYYSDMTVGNAEQLISDDYTTNDTPYNFRTAGGDADIGNREYDELVGGTLVWNQLCLNGNFDHIQNWQGREDPGVGGTGWVTNATAQWLHWEAVDNELVVTTTADKTSGVYVAATNASALSAANGHKILFKMDAWCNEETTESPLAFRADTTGANVYLQFNITEANKWVKICAILQKNSSDQNNWVYVRAQRASQTIKIRRVQIFDLTAMYGTSIADHIFALEQANTGAGVAWFENQFRNLFYAYNAGELMSVQAASHDMVGFNQWDEEWELGSFNVSTGEEVVSISQIRSKNYIPVFPSTKYFYSTQTVASQLWANILFYDADKNYITYKGVYSPNSTTNANYNNPFTTPSNARFCRFTIATTYGTTYNNDICINLSWSGYRNGEYEPYEKHSYPLDSTLTLRGIPKLDASNNLYYDGDTYASDGTVTRRYKQVTIPTNLTWSAAGGTTKTRYTSLSNAGLSDIKANSNTIIRTSYSKGDALMGATVPWNDFRDSTSPSYMISYDNYIGINLGTDNLTSEALNEWLTAHPLTLVYELATPTSETADAYQTPQIVNDFGTEQYVDAAVAAGTRDVAIPVGHDTRYTQNLRDKLRRLPNMPDSDGVYNVLYTGRQCEFIAAPAASDATPQPLGVAAAGTDTDYARADHVHERPVEIDIDRKKLDNVLSLMNGALSVQNTDSTAAYQKAVPAKAQPYAAINEIGGKSVCWNQTFTECYQGSAYSVEVTRGEGGKTILNGTTSAANNLVIYNQIIPGHKYISTSSASLPTGVSWGSVYMADRRDTGFIFSNGSSTGAYIAFEQGAIFDNWETYFNIVDLTVLYGAGNEPTTVAEFKSRYPASHYAYNAGQLISAGVTGAVSRGKNDYNVTYRTRGTTLNVFDYGKYYIGLTRLGVFSNNVTSFSINADGSINYKTNTGYYGIGLFFPCNEGEVYTISFVATRISGTHDASLGIGYANSDGTNIGNEVQNGTGAIERSITIPANCKSFSVILCGTTADEEWNFSNIQLERGSTATAYTPYRAPVTLPIPAAVQQLPGYGWSAGSVYNYIDWQRKVYVQNVGAVDMGTLTWTAGSDSVGQYFYTDGITDRQKVGDYQYPNIASPRYTVALSDNVQNRQLAYAKGDYTTRVYVRDTDYASAADYKSAMHGMKLYYQLETPIETDISDLLSDDNLIEVEPGGTISFPSALGDDYRLPVPSGVEYTIDLAPDAPTTDGTYTLQCTVADGVATYSWVSA